MFRLGLVSWVLVVILDVVVAWALQAVFESVSQALSRLAAWFRLAYAAILLVAVSQLVGVPDLLKGRNYPSVFGAKARRSASPVSPSSGEFFLALWLVIWGRRLTLATNVAAS